MTRTSTGLLCLGVFLVGCSTGQTSAPPTAPGEFKYEKKEQVETNLDGTVKTTVTTSVSSTNDENPDGGMGVKVFPDGQVDMHTRGGRELQLFTNNDSFVLWSGLGLTCLGILAYGASRHPLTMAFVPQGMALLTLGLGVYLLAFPYLVGVLKLFLGLGLGLIGVVLVTRYAKDSAWFSFKTSPAEIARMKEKHGVVAASMLEYFNHRGGKKGVLAAKVMRGELPT